MDINLTFGNTIFENVDCWMVQCSAEKSYTLEEWVEFAMETYGMNDRVTVILGETHTTFEAWNGTIELHADDQLQYTLFDIFKYKDVWGQRTLYLTMHGKTPEETRDEIFRIYGLPVPTRFIRYTQKNG